MLDNTENLPLIAPTNSFNFFQKSIQSAKQITFKTVAIVSVSLVSVVTYYTPAYQAGASVSNGLKEIAALSGIGTNFIFNLQAYRDFFDQLPQLFKMPYRLSVALFFSMMCVAPNLLMNLVDKEGNYNDTSTILLQTISAFFNIGVNVIGSIELINYITSFLKNKIDLQKEKLIEEINFMIEKISRSSTQHHDSELFANSQINLCQKLSYYFLNSTIALFSIPQLSAYLLINYFGMRDLVEQKLSTSQSISCLFGVFAALGNGIPGAGFSIKGVNSISKKLIRFKRPSLLTVLMLIPALFSGFTTHKAMADSLKKMDYSGDIAEALKWIANLGAALIYNLPQMLALTNVDTPQLSPELTVLKQTLEDHVQHLDTSTLEDFKTNLSSKLSHFFNTSIEENNLSDHLSLHTDSIDLKL
ncbi:hypothetical protein [Rickettsiella grylli]|uniref:Membrane protein n=1 Tax=Rickettsiella grylli TaxID=59196 RepID=A8PKP0_9COXI|nr:hypothetical protein [Rickettsiella grylli]EDP45754.1 putative membrane protein [Rickettsiella grylli]